VPPLPVVIARPPVPDAAPPDAAPLADETPPKLRLPKTFVPTLYSAALTIDPGQPTFSGTIAINGRLTERTQIIWLHGRHMQVEAATVGGTTKLAVTPRGDDLLELRAEAPLDPGAIVIDLEYTGEVDRVNTDGLFEETAGGAPYVYTQHEAIYARRTFPCVDEPDSKVPWQLSLDIPDKLAAVSNTPIASELPDDHGRKRVTFAQTKPLPAYLVAFGVGPFEFVDAGKTKSGIPVRIITLAGRAAEAAYAAKVTPHIVDLLEDWFGMPYPFEKVDLLTIPVTAGFGAMENAGLVTVTASYLLLDPKHASWSARASLATGIAHELAHHWFGDYVTMAWWDDIWLNEGFANWMETKIVAKLEPAWHAELGVLDMRDTALQSDALVSARRVRQPIESVDDIYNVFDGITYDKGASVLAMFERAVGPAVFQRGVRQYLAAHAYGNATSSDFVAAISAAAGRDLAPQFASFLDQPGAPELAMHVTCAGAPRVAIEQHRYVPAGSPAPAAGQPWQLPVCVAYEQGGKRAETCATVERDRSELVLPGKTCPRWLMPNADARGYYHVALDADQVTALRDEAWPLLTWTERRALVFDIAAAALQAKLPLQLALSLVPKLLAGGDRFAIHDAVHLMRALDADVPDELRAKYEAAMRATFGPGAAKVGLAAKPGDDLDAETAREELVGAAAWSGREPDLVKQAVELADHWRDLPEAERDGVLAIAADADAAVFDHLLQDARSERDHHVLRAMFRALGSVRDPARQARALALLLDPAVDLRESVRVLDAASTDATRAAASRFVRDHDAELLRRMPSESADRLAAVVAATCDARQRDDLAAYLAKRFTALPGGRRAVAESVETMDQCIARRAAVEPELRAWLGGFRLPRPGKDKHR
jgi:alanyl aminopeptidase